MTPRCHACGHHGDLVNVTRLRPHLHRALVCTNPAACLARQQARRARGRG